MLDSCEVSLIDMQVKHAYSEELDRICDLSFVFENRWNVDVCVSAYWRIHELWTRSPHASRIEGGPQRLRFTSFVRLDEDMSNAGVTCGLARGNVRVGRCRNDAHLCRRAETLCRQEQGSTGGLVRNFLKMNRCFSDCHRI
jgi:hypothetical protein